MKNVKIGDKIEVWEREAAEGRGMPEPMMDDGGGRPEVCEVVGFADKKNGIVIVDAGTIRLAQWIGSDQRIFRF